MTRRDRLVLVAVAVIAAIAASWILVVSPKRDQAAKLGTKVASEQQKLDTARTELAQNAAAGRQYASNYAALARLGEAVPASDDIPSLIIQLQNAADGARVDFQSLQNNAAASGGTPGATAPATGTAGASRCVRRTALVQLQRKLLPALELLQQGPALRDAQRQRGPGPRAPDLAQQRQPGAGVGRVPADHRTDHRDDLHRGCSLGVGCRGDRKLFGGVVDPEHLRLLILDPGPDRRNLLSRPMKTLKDIVTDLRQRRLWPVALVLVLALVAVPVLLSKKASSTPVAQLPATGAPTSLSTSGPAVTVEGTPNQTHLKGKARNPFTPQGSTSQAVHRRRDGDFVAERLGLDRLRRLCRGIDRRRLHRLHRLHGLDRLDRLDRWQRRAAAGRP